MNIERLKNFNPTVSERNHLRQQHGVKFADGVPTPCGKGYYPARQTGGYSNIPVLLGTTVVLTTEGRPGYHAEVAWIPKIKDKLFGNTEQPAE